MTTRDMHFGGSNATAGALCDEASAKSSRIGVRRGRHDSAAASEERFRRLIGVPRREGGVLHTDIGTYRIVQNAIHACQDAIRMEEDAYIAPQYARSPRLSANRARANAWRRTPTA